MAKAKNQRIYGTREHLEMLVDEQENFIGRDFEVNFKEGFITIFALPRKYKSKKENKPKERDKRSEKFERRDK